jgi:hypothetical protein
LFPVFQFIISICAIAVTTDLESTLFLGAKAFEFMLFLGKYTAVASCSPTQAVRFQTN